MFASILALTIIAINNNCYRTWSISADTSQNHRTHPCTTTETILHCGIHYSPGLSHKYTRVFLQWPFFIHQKKYTIPITIKYLMSFLPSPCYSHNVNCPDTYVLTYNPSMIVNTKCLTNKRLFTVHCNFRNRSCPKLIKFVSYVFRVVDTVWFY